MILSPQSSIEIFDNILSFVKSLDLNIIPLNELNVVEEIGFGSQGKVFHGLYKNKTVAIKIAEDVDLKCIKNEIEICSKLNHPNIINLLTIVTSKPNDTNKFRGNVYLVFDYIEHLDFYYFYFIVKITEIIINIDSYQIVQIKFQKWNQEVIMLVYFHFLIFSF